MEHPPTQTQSILRFVRELLDELPKVVVIGFAIAVMIVGLAKWFAQ